MDLSFIFRGPEFFVSPWEASQHPRGVRRDETGPSRSATTGWSQEQRRSAMPGLHPTHCACQDCRSRRLIRDDDGAAERTSAEELEDFGFLLKGKPTDRPGY